MMKRVLAVCVVVACAAVMFLLTAPCRAVQCTDVGVTCKLVACSILTDQITQVTQRPRDFGTCDPFAERNVVIVEGQCGSLWAHNIWGQCPAITGAGGGKKTSQNCESN
jgi:hypothetical protein